MCELTLLGCLGICAVDDIREKKIRQYILLVFGVMGVLLRCFSRNFDPVDMFCGFLIGVFVFVMAVLSKEQIGKGDALLLMISGIYLGFWGNVSLLFIASVLAGTNGLFQVIKNRSNLKKRMAFVPYLMVSYVVMMVVKLYERGFL